MNVEIETTGEFTRGRTVADVYGISGRAANAEVAMGMVSRRSKR